MGAYRLNVDLKGANGFAKANPQFWKGGLEQVFMSDFQELSHNKFISRLDGSEIKLKNIEVSNALIFNRSWGSATSYTDMKNGEVKIMISYK
jgi:hypothetical protein